MSVSKLTSIEGATVGELQLLAQRYNRTVACTQAYYVAHKDDPKATSPFPDGCFIVIKDDTQSVMDGFVNQMYPIGSVYINAKVDTNPATLFNIGTWYRISGKFLYGTSDDGELETTGGSATVTLTQQNLPATATFTIPSVSLSIDSASTAHTHTVTINSTSTEHTHSGTTGTPNDFTPKTTLPSGDIGGSGEQALCYDIQYINSTTIDWGLGSSNHTHSFTTGGMSANSSHGHTNSVSGMSTNETHTHTGSTVATEKTISDFGSGTSFSIIPPYQKVNIWVRNS